MNLHTTALSLTACLVLGAAPAPGRSTHPAWGPDEVDTILQELKASRDSADPELIVKLANQRSRPAMEGLLEVYDSMGSIYMKREVVRALATFDGVHEAEQPALQKIMDVATDAKDRELRDAAIEALAECPSLGKHFLAIIVRSDAEEDVREKALRRHVERADESDKEWYTELYEIKERPKKKKKRKGAEGEEDREVRTLGILRVMAFEALAKDMEEKKIVAALSDRYFRVRGAALEELDRREHKQVEELAREKFEYIEERPEVRAVAAGILAREKGPREADGFITCAKKFITPTELRFALAELLAGFEDEKVNNKLIKLVGKGKVYEKLFALQAARKVESERLDKALRKQLADKNDEVRVAAAEIVAERGDTGAVPALEKLVDKSKSPEVIAACLDALSTLRAGDAEWVAELEAYAQHEEIDIRNAALLQLGKNADSKHRELLTASLSDPIWSTRLAAVSGLEKMRDKQALGAIVEQMSQEKGRMLHEFADVLWRLTGLPFRTSVSSWQQWWERESESFEIISQTELEKREQDEEERRLRQVSNATFFGIRIVSHRVVFIIDISGSMNELTQGRYLNQKGGTRMEVAKRELQKCIDGMDKDALFNIIAFNAGVSSWLDGGVATSDSGSRDEAKQFVDRLDAAGATNLYDAVRNALTDPDVDTIFILSDGEPTAGEKTDQYSIREDVQLWNEHRGITINTIAVGGELQILEWLAEDSAGSHVKFR